MRDGVRRGLLTLGLLAGVFVVTFGGAYVLFSPGRVVVEATPVPVVTGLLEDAATRRLTEVGFRVRISAEAPVLAEPAGVVIRQDPMAGMEAPPGHAVELAISTGPRPVAVPDVASFPLDLARETMLAAGLRVGRVDSVAGPAGAEGLIVVSRPAAGTPRAPGETVDLVVSRLP